MNLTASEVKEFPEINLSCLEAVPVLLVVIWKNFNPKLDALLKCASHFQRS